MTEATQFSMQMEPILSDPGDSIRKLYEIVSEVEGGLLLRPPHQRDFIWDADRRRAWVNRLVTRGNNPVGVIVTYQLKGNGGASYLNDGWQRVSTTREFLAEPEKYGLDRERAVQVVKACSLPVQHRHYSSHAQALEDFQNLNRGTSLTPLEYCQGILTYMDGYDLTWRPILESVHICLRTAAPRVIARRRTTRRRESVHVLLRHDYDLFTRFITGFKHLGGEYESVTLKNVTWESMEKRRQIEFHLRSGLETLGANESRTMLRKFEQFIDNETAMIESVWHDVRPEAGVGITEPTYRWILAIAIWRRNNDLPVAKWVPFLRALLTNTKGSAQCINPSNPGNRFTLGLSQPNNLKPVCDIIGSDLYTGKRERRRRASPSLRPGYDASHVVPFSTSGDGPTIPEPASINRARGAKPMELGV